MNWFYLVVNIMAGCGAFLLGFKVLSDNMEKIAGSSLKKLFNKTSDKKLVNVGMGAAATAVVQSSAVTTVMVVGFVNVGIMSLSQAAAIIMGANIGTTITAQIAALQAFDVDLIFMILLFVGVFMEMFSKNDKVRSLGLALAGLGLVFVGLGLMSDPMSALKESEAVTKFLSSVNNELLLLFIGIIFTALIQSSSAVTTILISMASAGLVIGGGGNAPLYVILGSNIGSCVTALISSIGTSVNARRASIIHLLFNVLGSIIFSIFLFVWKDFSAVTLEKWFSKPSTQIAMFHTFFNVACTLLFLPFSRWLVKASEWIVPDKKNGQEKESVPVIYMDKRFLATPSLAIGQLHKESYRMADMAIKSLNVSLNGFLNRNVACENEVMQINENVAKLSSSISDYLVQVSASGVSLRDEKKIAAIHSDVGDIVRIAELAENFVKYTKKVVNDQLVFSVGIEDKISAMHALIEEQYAVVKQVSLDGKRELLAEADRLEEQIDTTRSTLVAEHIARMSRGECRPENNTVFTNLVSNLERVGDHINFLAHSADGI